MNPLRFLSPLGNTSTGEAEVCSFTVDAYHLLVYPLVLGGGQRLFAAGSDAKLQLVEAKTFSSSVVALIYHPAQSE